MSDWKNFEIECVKFLNTKYVNKGKFILNGGENSNVSDIIAETNSAKIFNIEVKKAIAQSGQFVLLPDIQTKKFIYSKANASVADENVLKIIEYMNKNFALFKDAGTKGKKIEFYNSNLIFEKWISNYYKKKNVKYFISENYTIIPVDKISKYFDITASYRVKKSGSHNIGKSPNKAFLELINNKFSIISTKQEGAKLFVSSSICLKNKKFIFENQEFMFAQRESFFELRKLSNTFNANVIFSISLQNSQENCDLEAFEKEFA